MKAKLILSLIVLLSCGPVFGIAETDDLVESMTICLKLEKASKVELLYTSLSQVQDFMKEQAIFKVYLRDCSCNQSIEKPKWHRYTLRSKEKFQNVNNK